MSNMASFALLALASILSTVGATPLDVTNAGLDLAVRDGGRDCGAWTMFCGGIPDGKGGRGHSAEGACNNACYYINFIAQGGEYTATYDSKVDNTLSREQSGCQTNAGNAKGSVCNVMPFSQKFHDPFERETDPTKQKFNCDEFPMAEMKQPDFQKGTIRNSLRCIDADENSTGGSQLNNFIQGQGNGLQGRKDECKGKLQDGDTYKVQFDYDGADHTKMPYCKYPGNNPSKDYDPYQFYMTDFKGMHGTIDFPYKADRDNHYAIADIGKDVLQCKVQVTRTSGDNYNAAVYDVDGNEQGTGEKELTNDQDSLIVQGKGGLNDLAIFRTGEMGKAGTPGSAVDFNYGDHSITTFNLATDFTWTTASTGTAADYANQSKDVVQPGGYCEVPNISENEDGDSQTITCYFPCLAQ